MKRTPKLVGRTSQSIQVRWLRWRNPPDHGDGPVSEYLVQSKTGPVDVWQEAKTSQMQKNITGLTPGKMYRVRVRVDMLHT